jgi:hypothetical protein
MVEAMGKINDNDFIPILKAFNLQSFERHIKCLKNWNESCFFKHFGGIYKGIQSSC